MRQSDSDSGCNGTWCRRRRQVFSKSGHIQPGSRVGSGDPTKDENNNDIHPLKCHEQFRSFNSGGNSNTRLLLCGTDYNKTDLKMSRSSSNSSKSQFNFKSDSGSGVVLGKKNWPLVSSVVLIILVSTLCGNLPSVESVCVWQGGGGFRVACGFRQSGLFRIRSLGGLKGYLGGGFTIGDEDGFKDSLTNTDPVKNNNNHLQQGQGQQGYPNGYQRVGMSAEPLPSPLPLRGPSGVPYSLEELKRQEQLRYLQQIQTEQILEHQVLQQQAAMGRQQKQLFNRIPMSPSVTPPTRSGGGITKRASMWRWPFNGKGQNPGGSDGRRIDKSGRRRGSLMQQGPLTHQAMMQQSQTRPMMQRGPPLPGQRQEQPPQQNHRVPNMQGQGPFPRQFQSFPPRGLTPQVNVARQGYAPVPDDDYDDFEKTGFKNQIPHPQSKNQFKLPHQIMMPPPSPSNSGVSPQGYRHLHQPSKEDISHLQLPPGPRPSQIPHGLQMLQNTENYGSMFQLIGKPNQPSNTFQHLSPSGVPPRPISQPQNQVHRTLSTTQEEQDEQGNYYLSGLGNLDRDDLATAVYDPNIFPDIYFTSTTERGNSLVSQTHDIIDDEQDFPHRLDTAALHTNENIERIDNLQGEGTDDNFAEAPAAHRKKQRRRRKKFRLLKKKGELNSDVGQDLEDNTQEGQSGDKLEYNEQDQQLDQTNNNDGEIETPAKKPRRRKKGRRRKKPSHSHSFRNSSSSQDNDETHLVREAVSSGVKDGFEELPISGPSPLTLTLTVTQKPRIKTTTPTTTTTTTTTPEPRIEMSTFGYHEALGKQKQVNKTPVVPSIKYHEEDTNASNIYSKSSVEQLPYDPRFPPTHEINKGRIPNKFIRQRDKTTTPTPFVSGGLNILSPDSLSSSKRFFELNAPGSTMESVKFSPSTELSSSFVKFDSRESIKSIERTKLHNDKFYTSHYNKSSSSNSGSNSNKNYGPTAFSNPGFYDRSPPFSQEMSASNPQRKSYPSYPRPPPSEEMILPWEQQSFFSSTVPNPTRSPIPIYPRKSNTMIFDQYGPTSPSPDLKKTLFGGEDHSSNWEAPNFWGSIQQVDRYGPTSDFVTNDNFKRVLELDNQRRNSFQVDQHDQRQSEPSPSMRPPPEPPVFDDHQYHSFFDSTPNSVAESKWETPQRKLSHTTPTPSFFDSSTFHSDLEGDVENHDLKFEQLPVKELELDNFGKNNFNFISSSTSTSTTAIPEVIKDIRIKHSRAKKRKQKRPDVSIKIRGDNQPETVTTTPTQPTSTLHQERKDTDIIVHDQDSKAKSTFTVGQSIGFGGSGSGGGILGSDVKNSVSVAQNGFDGNFVPSSSPHLKENENPFANFDSVFPQNPFSFTNSNPIPNSNRNNSPGTGGMSSSELNRHKFDGEQGQGGQIPISQNQESSSEHRQVAHPNEIPQYGSGSQHFPPTGPTNEDALANIVPSPPDPVLHSEVVPFGNDKRLEFPSSIPVLRPDFDDSGNIRWDQHQSNNDDERSNNVPSSNERNKIPQSIQILNIQNQPPQPPQLPSMSGNFYGSSFQNIQQHFQNQQHSNSNFPNQQPHNFQNQQQINFHAQSQLNNQDQGPPFNNGNSNSNALSPSIKLVRPTGQQNQNQNQNYFQAPPPQPPLSSSQKIPFEESYKFFQMPQKPPPQSQQPYQLFHVPAQPPPSTKTQFQKNSPPKKYQQDAMNSAKHSKSVQHPYLSNNKNNIPLPNNPYILQHDMNNFKKIPGHLQQKPSPTKIPNQKFQPPPPPNPTPPSKNSGGGGPSFLSRLNPFNRGPPSPSSSSSSSSNSNNKQQQSTQNQSKGHNPKPNPINPYNNRFQPPPLGPSTKGVEVTYVDLDDNLNPPRLVPPSMSQSQSRQPQHNHPPPPRQRGPQFPPPPRREDNNHNRPMSEKDKVLQAIATLNNVKYDVIQSVAEEQFGTEILERIKAKKAQEHQVLGMTAPPQTIPTTTTTARPMFFPILSTMAPLAGSFLNMMGTAATAAADAYNNNKSPPKEDQRMTPSGLSNLLNSFGGYGDSALNNNNNRASVHTPKSPTIITSLSTDAITNLFNSLTSGEVRPYKPSPTTPPTTTPTPMMVRLDTMIGNSGGSMELINGHNQDIKSLQAQLAKAILAKANRKKTGYMPVGPSPSSPNPLGLIDSLAQNKNYTQSQISTLKKLIALNNIEQKLNHQLGLDHDQTTQRLSVGVGPTIKSLLSPSGPSVSGMTNTNSVFSNKMLSDPELQMLNTVQSSGGMSGGGLHNDPTLLALKAYALKRAQSIQQPNVEIHNKNQDESSSDFKPIPVDLSAILSPAPPLEEPRKRRLTDVRNAPQSFYPVNATLGFDTLGSGPGSALSTDFSCEGQNFFPGLYADTGLGCKVFHLCAKTDAGFLLKSFRCPKHTVFDQEVLKCNWSLYVNCAGSQSNYHFNKYLSQSFQFLKVLGEFSKNATNNG